MNIDLSYLQALVKLVSDEGLSELKVSSGDKKVIIKKEKQVVVQQQTPVMTAPTVVSQVQDVVKQEESSVTVTEKSVVQPKKGQAVVSPMDGTFYRSPSPDSPPFIEVGQKVEVGAVLCIIESMKLMNEIESDFAGVVTEICVKNADAVESGMVLMYIE